MRPALGPLTPPHLQAELLPSTGAAALAMAATALWPNRAPWRSLEHELWQAATDQPVPDEDQGRDQDQGQMRELFPAELALAALREGLHARLVGTPRPGADAPALAAWSTDAQAASQAWEQAAHAAHAAGLHEESREPTTADVERALAAGHPVLLLIDASTRHQRLGSQPHYVVLTGLEDERLTLHDPRKAAGPEEGMLSRFPAVSGVQGSYALLEVGHGVRLRQRG